MHRDPSLSQRNSDDGGFTVTEKRNFLEETRPLRLTTSVMTQLLFHLRTRVGSLEFLNTPCHGPYVIGETRGDR